MPLCWVLLPTTCIVFWSYSISVPKSAETTDDGYYSSWSKESPKYRDFLSNCRSTPLYLFCLFSHNLSISVSSSVRSKGKETQPSIDYFWPDLSSTSSSKTLPKISSVSL